MTNSHEWIDRIIKKLFEAEDRYSARLISELNRQNSEIKRKRFPGFLHMGKPYYVSRAYIMTHRAAREPLPTLAFSLIDQADKFITQQKRIDLDKSQIRQVLFGLLHQCNTLQEIRDVLPECLVSMLPEIACLSRCRQNPLYMVESDKQFIEQFNRVLPKIEFYAMSHMIY